ncbi:MAG: glutamine--fructose-6-phosphate transaminase (isomerizing) [Haloarculaceae archaeon]
MCGIVGRAGEGNAVPELLSALQTLEYRGYDSAGIAVENGSGLSVHKRSGEVSDISEEIDAAVGDGSVGIGHTRWSTHGPPTDVNAHPHTSADGEVAVVHNGVIENHADLREWLRARGYEFESDTDTEVVPHLVDHYRDEDTPAEAAFRRAVSDLKGSYAIAALIGDRDAIYAAREGSPLVVGLGETANYLASDVPAFLEYTDEVLFLEDGDVAVITPEETAVTTLEGDAVERQSETVDISPEETGKGAYDHYMLKEIHTQPNSLANTIEGRIDPDDGSLDFEGLDTDAFAGIEEVQFVACGTSYHAALFGATLLEDAGFRAQAFRASEYTCANTPISDETLVVAVTQSGETADTLAAMRRAADEGAPTLAVTNVTGSSAAREADHTIFIRAGPEIGVAATKTFSSQAVTLVLLSQVLAREVDGMSPREDRRELAASIVALPDHIESVLARDDARHLAGELFAHDAYFFIGRGFARPVAMEGALKFKEITYEHAEAFASGELKHGPLALVTPNTPVFALFFGEGGEKTLTNAMEAQTRGADIVGVGPDDHDGLGVADAHLWVPDAHPVCQALLANVQLQLISYHAADLLDRPIDKPRNLAKSVTVE